MTRTPLLAMKNTNIRITDNGISAEGSFSEEKPRHFENPQERKRIIIIDDEPKIRIIFTHALSKAGYETIAFGDNAKVIEYLKNDGHRVDLLLLDLNMPHIDSRYFREMLRIKHPQAKIIIVSNYVLDIQKYVIFDADDYFDKSGGIHALKEKVTRVLSNKE